MKEPVWIAKKHVITMHAMQIHEHGGVHGLRDEGLLESSIIRPQNLFHYKSQEITHLAAGYGYGLINNHPFVDGNKRIGMVCTGVFLLLNGFSLEVAESELVLAGLQLASKELTEDQFFDWITHNVMKV